MVEQRELFGHHFVHLAQMPSQNSMRVPILSKPRLRKGDNVVAIEIKSLP